MSDDAARSVTGYTPNEKVGDAARMHAAVRPSAADQSSGSVESLFDEALFDEAPFGEALREDFSPLAQKSPDETPEPGDVILTLDVEGNFRSVNSACEAQWGYRPEELIGKHFSDLVSPDERSPAWLSMIDTVLLDRRQSFRLTIVHKNGTGIESLWSAQCSIREQTIYCTVSNIRQRRLAKDRLSTMIHDLVTPLNSVRSLLSLVSNNVYGPISDPGKIRLKQGEKELDRLASIIDGLLELEQISTGRLVLSKKAVYWDDIVDAAINQVKSLAEEKCIRIKKAPSRLSGFADADRMTQVLADLLSNAIKFSQKNKKIFLSLERCEASTLIKVIDQGVGIASDKIEDVFGGSLYGSYDDHKRTRCGIGLSICKAIVEEHGGQIWATSKLGSGSTFCVRIPDYP